LAKLYAQATEAYGSENWLDAIKALEELLDKSADYKDAFQLLKDAKKQRQLRELYTEAKRLHTAQKWQAVIKVFEQIAAIEPDYPDPEGLLPSAQQEAAELKRLADLNALYRQGVHQMDSGQWYEARSLLEQVHKAQTGFLDTERLLRKVENEIIKIEEFRKRIDQINTLYEQAHGLIRSRSWRMVLDKMEEIQRLDDQFVDKDEIFEKAKIELEYEEQAAQRQNELAAMYAESVRLLKEGKYQEALDQWQEVRAIDPKYPDRQRVQSTAAKRLRETEKPLHHKPRIMIAKPLWMGALVLVVIVVLIAGVILSGKKETASPATATSGGSIPAIPTLTTAPGRTDIPQASATVAPTIVSDPLMYDDFNNSTFDGRFNTALWEAEISAGQIIQENGSLNFELSNYEGDIGLRSIRADKPASPIFIESKMMMDPASRKGSALYIAFDTPEGGSQCVIYTDLNNPDSQRVYCQSVYFEIVQSSYDVKVTPGIWHILRIELYPDTMIFNYLLDGKKVGSYVPRDPDKLKNLDFSFVVNVNAGTDANRSVTGYVDYFKTGKIEESEMKQTAYRWDFGSTTEGWGDEFYNDMRAPYAQDGYLIIETTRTDPYISSPIPLSISASKASVITVRMRIRNGDGSVGALFFLTSRDNNWDHPNYWLFPIMNDGVFHTYDINMSLNGVWKDVITAMRLDPMDDLVSSNVQFEIDYISVHAP